MGIYEYECPVGHVTERMVSLAERPDSIMCEQDVPNGLKCGETAKFVLSATPTTFRAMDRKCFKRQGH